jgi:hypothetical protein
MSSIRQIEANRRNAQFSTGPVTKEGKRKSRQNAVRHGLTAETVIDALEDAEDYKSFQLAIASDYDAPTAVERELVLRLASVLWRLRRATAIETGLFEKQARQLLQFRRLPPPPRDCQAIIKPTHQREPTHEVRGEYSPDETRCMQRDGHIECDSQFESITNSFLRLSELPTAPLDRLSRYEAALWRQACQIVLTLRCPGGRMRLDRTRFR